MQESQQTIKELKAEVEHLRAAVSDIHDLSSELVDGEHENHDEVAGKIRAELERLRTLVSKDELTGILNRRGFYERFTNIFQEALFESHNPDGHKRRVTIPDFTIMFLDLDDFKQVNDTYGHDAGDVVLKETARLLGEEVRDIDGAIRLGGEEFVLALVGADENLGAQKAESILQKLAKEVKVPSDEERVITASIGIASLGTSDADDLDELVGYADKAMYEAKTNRGKNTIVRYSELEK